MTDQNTPPRQRGRHRKPRPRKLLLAAGGLAMAAGVLSLVRMTPDSGVGNLGTAEAEPRPDPGTDQSPNTESTLAASPTAIPTTASVPRGPSTTPAPTKTQFATPTKAPLTPTDAPETPTTSATTTNTPRPTPTPTQPTNSPTPDQPGICIPVIDLCVDPLITND
ncbi:hypothetical protein [Streptomyces sp. GESEQ-35]|uniref:hypothetical protein n=1 Tax=Streptomyces sp. GESEQ-35 TaxID=2812657 RepID=UPI0027E2D0C8|nr:hypothetical protein [Streptomyces sp. GESEQ-35]